MNVWRTKQRQCGSKARHDSEYDARHALVTTHGRSPEFNVYLCPHCEFWHVGHSVASSDRIDNASRQSNGSLVERDSRGRALGLPNHATSAVG